MSLEKVGLCEGPAAHVAEHLVPPLIELLVPLQILQDLSWNIKK
jgi:hypothetical protein